MDESKTTQPADETTDMTAESTEENVEATENTAPKGKRAAIIAAASVVAVALIGGIAWGVTSQQQPAAPTQKSPQEAVAQADQDATTSLIIKANHSGWTEADGLARVKVKSGDKVVAEKEVKLNEAVQVSDLDPGNYKVELAPPVLADGTIFAPLSSATIDAPKDGSEPGEDMATHDKDARTATLEVTLQPIPEADMTEPLIDVAVNAYAKDDAEKTALKDRAMAKMKAYKEKQAEEQKAAEEAAANGTATPEQIAKVEASGGYVAPESYDNSGYVPPAPSGGGEASGGGGGSTSGGDGGGGSTTPPANDRYEGNPKYGYWTAVWTYTCNTCGVTFATEASAAAHCAASQEAWANTPPDQRPGGYCTGYSGSSRSVWVWY